MKADIANQIAFVHERHQLTKPIEPIRERLFNKKVAAGPGSCKRGLQMQAAGVADKGRVWLFCQGRVKFIVHANTIFRFEAAIRLDPE